MKKLAIQLAAATFALSVGTFGAAADQCSGHSHDTGTALGAGGGALVGGLATHSVGGAVVGGVAGAFAGNAIARNEDCNHPRRARDRDDRDHHRHYYIDRDGHRHYR